MRNCIINIADKEYIPVRALPLITMNNLSPAEIIKILSGDNPVLLVDSYLLEDGELIRIDCSEFKELNFPNNFSALPAKLVVDFSDFKIYIWENIYPRPTDLDNDPFYSYPATGILISDEDYTIIMEGIQVQKFPRKNDANLKRNKVLKAISKIQEICLSANIDFDLNNLLCTKLQLFECINLIDKSIGISYSTFIGHNYYKHYSLNFKCSPESRVGKGLLIVEAVKKA